MAKSAKLTICHIRSIPANFKYSIILLELSLKIRNITLFSESGGEICGHMCKNRHFRSPGKL